MFHFIDDKEFLAKLKSACSDIVNQLEQEINNDNKLTVNTYLVGSGARNLITQDGDKPVDLDYQLELIECAFNNPKDIKEYVRKTFNVVLAANGWNDCSDSTSVLSTQYMQFVKGNNTNFKIDLAIISKDDKGNWWRLIHKKTGNFYTDSWVWEQGRDSKGLETKVKKIKDNDCWEEVRDTYLEKKNLYLVRNDYNHPSFICYIETINEIYYKHFE